MGVLGTFLTARTHPRLYQKCNHVQFSGFSVQLCRRSASLGAAQLGPFPEQLVWGPTAGPMEPTDAAAQTLSGWCPRNDTVTRKAEDPNPELILKRVNSKDNKGGTGHSSSLQRQKQQTCGRTASEWEAEDWSLSRLLQIWAVRRGEHCRQPYLVLLQII